MQTVKAIFERSAMHRVRAELRRTTGSAIYASGRSLLASEPFSRRRRPISQRVSLNSWIEGCEAMNDAFIAYRIMKEYIAAAAHFEFHHLPLTS